MSAPTPVNQEKHTLEMIDGSFPVRDEREEALWRAFVAMFAQNHEMSDLFTFDEVLSAYHAFLRLLINMEVAAGRNV